MFKEIEVLVFFYNILDGNKNNFIALKFVFNFIVIHKNVSIYACE